MAMVADRVTKLFIFQLQKVQNSLISPPQRHQHLAKRGGAGDEKIILIKSRLGLIYGNKEGAG